MGKHPKGNNFNEALSWFQEYSPSLYAGATGQLCVRRQKLEVDGGGGYLILWSSQNEPLLPTKLSNLHTHQFPTV